MEDIAKKKRILVVDDAASVRRYVQTILECSEYEVTAVTNVKDALQKIKPNHDYAAILLDINMPGKDGFSLLEALLDKPFQVPVCIVSGSNSKDDIMTGLRLGASDYLVKPFQPQILLKKVEDLVLHDESMDKISNVNYPAKLANAPVKADLEIVQISRFGFIAETNVIFREGVQASFHSEALNKDLGLLQDYEFQARVVATDTEDKTQKVMVRFVGLDIKLQDKIAVLTQLKTAS